MRSTAFDKTLAALDQLQCGENEPDAVALVRKTLSGRSNFLVAKAAKIAGNCGWSQLTPEMLTAWDRFFDDPVKSDPQCAAKKAIAKTLAGMEYDDPGFYLRGLVHVQLEPVWGGTEDTAGPLRGQCALALVACRSLSDLDVLTHLTEVLVDSDKTVRAEAARAVGGLGKAEGALLLRLRVLSGEAEPEVLGALFSSLLECDRTEGIRFVSRFLDGNPERAEEAAMALGLTHDERALDLLCGKLPGAIDSHIRAALMRGIALTRLRQGIASLTGLVEEGGSQATLALEALTCAVFSDEGRNALREAVRKSGDEKLLRLFEKLYR